MLPSEVVGTMLDFSSPLSVMTPGTSIYAFIAILFPTGSVWPWNDKIGIMACFELDHVWSPLFPFSLSLLSPPLWLSEPVNICQHHLKLTHTPKKNLINVRFADASIHGDTRWGLNLITSAVQSENTRLSCSTTYLLPTNHNKYFPTLNAKMFQSTTQVKQTTDNFVIGSIFITDL